MSNIDVVSTTDTPEAVTAAIGNLAPKENSEETKSEEIQKKEITEKKSESDQTQEELENDETKEGEESETSEDDEKGEKENKPKRRGGYRRKIDKLSTKLSAAEDQAEYWRQKALGDGTVESKETVKTESKNEKPVSDDFESHDEYVEALSDWKMEKKFSEFQEKQEQQTVKTKQEQEASEFQGKVEEFSETVEDFEEVIEGVDDIPMSLTVQQCILESDDGPQLMYELAKDPEEYERICRLAPIAAARALGRFESKIQKTESSEKPKKIIAQTKAPKPITPVGSKSGGTSTKNPDEMSFQEYKKWRENN